MNAAMVRVGAGVRLHVRVLGAEQRERALRGEVLGVVDDVVAAVVALGRIALGVLVGEHRALRLEHRRRREVLGRDELDRRVLPLELAPDDVGDLGVGALQRRASSTPPLLLRCAAISSRRRDVATALERCRGRSRVISSASSGATMRAPIDKHVGVVVLAGQARGVEVVAERGAHAVHLVGRDLLALAAAAEHDAELGVAARRRPGRPPRRSAGSRRAPRCAVPRSSTSWPHSFSTPTRCCLSG